MSHKRVILTSGGSCNKVMNFRARKIPTNSFISRQTLSFLIGILVLRVSENFANWYGTGKVHPRKGHEGPEREQKYSSTLSLTSALDGGWVVKATPWPLYRRERAGARCIGGLVGPRAGVENLASTRIRSLNRPACIESLYRLRRPGLPIGMYGCKWNFNILSETLSPVFLILLPRRNY
jgi:hypothetical protein